MNRFTVLSISTSFLLAGMLAPAARAQCCGTPTPLAAASVPTTPIGRSAARPVAFAVVAASVASVSAEPVNKACPIRGNKVDKESPTRQFKGVTIGFCCPGCEGKWDTKTDDDKVALLAKTSPEAITAIEAVAMAKPQAAANDTQPEAAALASNPAVKVARGYLAACGNADVKALDAMFLDKGRATVSENAGDEGTWENYRDHHLMPELKEMPGFAMTVTTEDVQTYGTTSIVRQIGSFTVPDPKHPDAPRAFKAAVTYVIVDDNGTPKIAHLHWSSRAERKPMADAPATPATGHGAGGGHEHK